MKAFSAKNFVLCLIVTSTLSFSQSRWNVRFGTEEFTGLQCKDLSWDRPDAVSIGPAGDIYVSGSNSHSTGEPKPNTIGAWVMKFTPEGKLVWFVCPSESFVECNPRLLSTVTERGVLLVGHGKYYYRQGELNVYLCTPSGEIKNAIIPCKDIRVKMDNQIYPTEVTDYPVLVSQDKEGNIRVVLCTTIRIERKAGDNLTISEPIQKLSLIFLTPDLKFSGGTVLDFPPLLYKYDEISYRSHFNAEAGTDGSFVLSLRDKDTYKNIIITKFDKNGNKLWSVQRGHPEGFFQHNINYLSTGEVVSVVFTGKNDEYSIFDAAGNEIKKFAVKNEGAVAKVKAIDNDFVMLYQLNSAGEGTVVVKKVNSRGEVLWKKTFGQSSSYGIDLEVGQDKSIVVLAYTKEFGACNLDGMLVKMDKDGNTEAIPKKYTRAN
ncbi:MAG: hypothetical protein NZ455_13110 [Bacteroidia bacterium]|nr:hypothetical protein [Bacteroidia bacterium]MDW8347062.1 hypothetical protein [Bacteroidia bacterium]